MIAAFKRPVLTLAIYPNARGFGWVAFEGPLTPHDWGMSYAKGNKNEYCLVRVEKLLMRFSPETVVLEAYEGRSSSRRPRVSRLCRAIASLAVTFGVQVAIYARGDVRACFAAVGARTRDEIAAAVARHIDAFRHKLPAARRAWTSDTLLHAMFSAAALVLTHNQLGSSTLFDSL